MRAWFRTLGEAAIFRTAAFQRLSDRGDAFLHGLLIIVVVALLTGLPGAVVDLVHVLSTGSVGAETADWRSDLERRMAQIAPLLDLANVPASARAAILAQFEENAELGASIAAQAAALPTRLPRSVGQVFRTIGGWLSRPFAGSVFPLGGATLATWLGYGIWVMLCAKLLGGRGGLVAFFGTTALFAVPHVLSIFALVPHIGGVLGFIGFAWGLAVYVKATAVSHEMSVGRALFAVFLPLLVALLIGLVLVAALVLAAVLAM